MVISDNQDKRNIWVVHLNGLKDYIIVREEDDQLEQVEKMTKTMSQATKISLSRRIT